MTSKLPEKWTNFYLKDVSFANLMMRRIYNVLIVANPYDAFMLEDDGRIEEKVYNEYMELGLRYPPTFTQASTLDEAKRILTTTHVDLVICMPGNADNDAFSVARGIKEMFPKIHCVVLTPFSHGITKRMQNEDLSIFDYVFCWLGNTNLILSIIKLLEDRMNLDNDLKIGVQMILLVEDSIRFYSSILPNLYNYILKQSQNFATEALTPHDKSMRMRGRPKVVLARNYEEAWRLYTTYRDNCLGVISDVRFPVGGEKDPEAGFKLLREIRKDNEYVPLIMESSEQANRDDAQREGFRFVDKNSKKLSIDLRHVLEEHMGFGDFIFRDPKTHEEVARVRSLKELQDNIFTIPYDSMLYHVSRNHMSRWLSARAIFPVAEFLKHITWHALQDVDAHRKIIFDAIVQYRRMKNQGVVAEFDRRKFDRYAHFARIGDGSLGGKGRGLAFLDNVIKRHPELNKFQNATVQIPKTVVLCTDIFDNFMEQNDLYQVALSDAPDDEILERFLRAQLPDSLIADFFAFFDATRSPIAIRSSSLLEDAHYQPFAGVYSTYMIPCLDDKYEMLRMLAAAIKSVYASVYYHDSKAYMTATSNVIDQEKMAVILQQVVGKEYGGRRFYPNISGVLRSINFYPVGDEKADEGIASLALGLGKYIVDGGQTLRVSPYHPQQVMQMSELETALRTTQTKFYAIDMEHAGYEFKVDDGFNILKLKVKDAANDGSLQYIASTYLPDDQAIYDGVYDGGRKIISFAGVLQQGVFPLPEIMQMSLKLGSDAMRRPVEIEFACNLNDDRTGDFYLLQIRPIVDAKQNLDTDLTTIADEACLMRSHNSLGHGIYDDVEDVIYVKTDGYTAQDNPAIAAEITQMNDRMLAAGRSYVLVGPGRWGSSDPWLGVPVKWPSISAARIIVEQGLKGYNPDPSQGTHFFQNLTSMGVGYFYINTYSGDGVLRSDLLDAMPAVEESPHLRHVSFPQPLKIMMDGMKQEGVVMMNDEC